MGGGLDDLGVLPEHTPGVLRRPRAPPLAAGGELLLGQVHVEPADGSEPWEDRKVGWEPNPPKYTRGVLGKYAKVVQSAAHGAVTS